MPAAAPPSVEVLVTAMPVPTFAEANVPVPLRVTTSLPTTPASDPVIVAAIVPSYVLGVTAELEIVSALGFTVLAAIATVWVEAAPPATEMFPE